MRRLLLLVLLTSSYLGCTSQNDPASLRTNTLYSIYQFKRPCNGITFDGTGHAFVAFPPPEGNAPMMRVAKVDNRMQSIAYPDESWNDWTPGKPADAKFVFANSLRVAGDGLLWIVDTGTPGLGKPTVKGGPKLVAIDTQSNKAVRTIHLDSVTNEKSFLDDVRFNGAHAYATDAGWPGLIVIDMQTGNARRVLNEHPSTVDARPMFANGKKMLKEDGTEVRVHADQLELSPDGATLYYQPASGPMSKIATKYLDDASLNDSQLATHVESFFDSPTTGGTCIDADGNVYISDCDHQRILKVSPKGKATTVAQDDRLQWGDAMWIDREGNLWIPAAQLNRTPGMNHGINDVKEPVQIFKFPIRAKPVVN